MKKNTILYILLFFLIIVNGFFLFNYIGNGKSKNGHVKQKDKNFIVKELGFSEAQVAQFRKRSVGHHETMVRLNDDVKNLKDELFGKLSEDVVSDAVIDSITSLICEKEKEKDKEVFSHFKMIQELSDDKQKEKFKMIIMDAIRQGDRGDGPPPPGESGGHRPPRNN